MTGSAQAPAIPLKTALPAWSAIAAESFGGPVAQIGVLHRVIVLERRWVSEEQFQRALSFCMLLPGPEAQQLATYLGWLLHGSRGAIVAGSLFVLPGFIALLVLSLLYVYAGDTSFMAGVLAGIQPAVVAIVAHTIPRLGRRVLQDRPRIMVALGAFLAFYFMRAPFPLVIAVAATIGVTRFSGGRVQARPPNGVARPSWRTPVLWIALWLLPWAAVTVALGGDHVLAQQAGFFAKSALVTFGGAYAVLTYVAQEAVQRFHWLSPSEMVTGLGFAESTPGPLIQVVQFVAFLGAFRASAPLDPLTGGILASVLVTWLTFVPSFLFILTLAPYVERLAQNRWLLGALQGIGAAVLGAMLNLAVWFALHTIFGQVTDLTAGPINFAVPQVASADWLAIVIAIACLVALIRGVSHAWLLVAAAGLGVLTTLWR